MATKIAIPFSLQCIMLCLLSESDCSSFNHVFGLEYNIGRGQSALERFTRGSHIAYYSLMFFIAYAFKGQVHVFAGQVKIVSHSSCRTSAILKYFCPLIGLRTLSYISL